MPQNYTCNDCGAPTYERRSVRCRSCCSKHAAAERRALLIEPNPSGLCFCGCGELTPLASRSRRIYATDGSQIILNKPIRYVPGHSSKTPDHEVIIDPETGCHLWQGPIDRQGYAVDGKCKRGQSPLIHKRRYEEKYGPVPEGLVLDHVRARGCIYRHCVNLDHLEPVTQRENVLRSRHCKLTVADIVEMRRIAPTMTRRELAMKFGISYVYAKKIVNFKVWKDAA